MKCSNKKKLIYIYFKEKQLFKSIWAFTSLPVHFGVWMRHFNWWWYHNCHIAFKTSMCVSRINLNIVDNGPGEQPPSLLKMLLVRLLKLESACQVRYGKYHSKRNFVERVHAHENSALSRHGPFSYIHLARQIRKNIVITCI